ncbi:MAG: hypothetical protein OES32_19960, partial [Acidobacteriota bacterium]|nr:hypothetical protein [Acidobacteriota bacterium]
MIPKLSTLSLACAAVLASSAAMALVQPADSPLADKELRHPGLDPEAIHVRIDELEPAVAAALRRDLSVLGLDPGSALLDARGAGWATLWLARPLVPGTGVDNRLTWLGLGLGSRPDVPAMEEAAWLRFRSFLDEYRQQLRIDPRQLEPRVSVHSQGQLIQIYGARHVDGIPVRGAGVAATVNHGNLVLLGTERWGKIDLSTLPSLSGDAAVERVVAHVAPFAPRGYRQEAVLEILPLAAASGFGAGYTHRLAWIVSPEFDGLVNRYEAAVDAHSGELL